MKLSTSVSSLGLYRYNCSEVKSELFSRFYAVVLDQLGACGVAPTYIGAEGIGYTGKLSKIGGRIHKKLLQSDFSDVSVLSISSNPSGSDEPAYDSFANASLSYVPVTEELLLCFTINEAFIELRTTKYEKLMLSLVNLCQWDFGYGFAASADKQPDFHILGIDNGELSPEEQNLLNIWYSAPAETRTAFLRDIYPYNILNETQLDTEVGNGIALRNLANQEPDCSLAPLADYGLHLWLIHDDAKVMELKRQLAGSPALIS